VERAESDSKKLGYAQLLVLSRHGCDTIYGMTVVWNKVTWYSKALTLLVFVLATVWAFYIGMQYEDVAWQAKQNTLSLSSVQVGQTIDVSPSLVDQSLETPPLYRPELQWTTASTVKKDALYVYNINSFTSKEVDLPGQEWTTQTCKVNFYRPTLFGYYLSELKDSRNWGLDLKVQGFNIEPLFSDGANSRTDGYVKVKDDLIRAVIISSVGSNSAEAGCFEKVFVSDIVSLNSVLK